MHLNLAVVIVSWNNRADVLRCLESVYANPGPFQVIAVDNASRDDTAAAIRERYPQVTLIQNAENLGYTGGNNVGITCAFARGADAVLLLNDDAVLAVDAIPQLLSAAAQHPEVGFLGPAIYALGDQNVLLSAGGTFTAEWDVVHRGMGKQANELTCEPQEVDFLSGCALLVRRSAVEKIGLLDDRFFVYHEDVDWCYRARQAGVKLLVVPRARVYHPDTRERDANSALLTYYMTRNRLLFLRKHRMSRRLIFTVLSNYMLQIANWSLRPKWRHKRRQRNALVYAVIDYASGRFGCTARQL